MKAIKILIHSCVLIYVIIMCICLWMHFFNISLLFHDDSYRNDWCLGEKLCNSGKMLEGREIIWHIYKIPETLEAVSQESKMCAALHSEGQNSTQDE